MHKEPIIISILLIVLSIAVIVWLAASSTLKLTHAERSNSIIAFVACMGALVSAVFIV